MFFYDIIASKERLFMKHVLISGAYGGMGKATAELFAKQGYTVFALDKRIDAPTHNIIPIEADVTDSESISSAFEKVCTYTDELYAIIHFAGIYRLDSLVEISEERFLQIFNINLNGVFRINKYFLPLLKKGSRIIITSSELAPLDPLPFTGIYAITKSALEKYAYSLRMELQLLGIKVCVIRPGAVKTPLLGDSTSELDKFTENTKLYSCNANRFKRIVDSVEAKNVTPEKIAKVALKTAERKRPRQVVCINRNPLLLLLNLLPCSLQTFIIKLILKP